jgi:transmembrane sensor
MSEQERQRAWDQLAAVEQHPQIQQWLDESDARRGVHREMPPSSQPTTPARKRLFWAAAASLVMAIGVASTVAYLRFGPRHFETGIGEQRDVLLADGSRIALNTDTALTMHYSAGSRRIELQRGEALFTVKHDAARPFDVAAGKTLTRALGTEFNVDMRRSNVTVSVLEGSVRVSAPPSAESGLIGAATIVDAALIPVAALARGQALEFSAKEQRLHAEKADLKRIDASPVRSDLKGLTITAQVILHLGEPGQFRVRRRFVADDLCRLGLSLSGRFKLRNNTRNSRSVSR